MEMVSAWSHKPRLGVRLPHPQPIFNIMETKKKIFSPSMVDTDVCTKNIGNRFDMVLVASYRTRELRRGAVKKISDTNSATVTALKEIEAGAIKRDYLKRLTTR